MEIKILFIILFILHSVFSDDFGTPYMKNRRFCQQWTCINKKLGLSDSLPPLDHYRPVLQGLLPEDWQSAVEPALVGCYGNRTRRYSNSCPGQALLQCTVEKLIENCPDAYWRKADVCAPVASLAGFNYMFSQGMYENIETSLPNEQRPPWFMKHYFSSKCCDLPALFSEAVLTQCGFSHMMHYQRHSPVHARKVEANNAAPTVQTPNSRDSLRVVELPAAPEVNDPEDPLDCCDMSGFIHPSWRSECNFRLKWDPQTRLSIEQPSVVTTTMPTTTTTPKSRLDVKVLPLSCAQETCVFNKLNVITSLGTVDKDAFSKVLDNLTTDHPAWARAKARVVTKCLTRGITNYEADCEINKILACTFDVLSENCPTVKKNDPCKRSGATTNDTVCQISSAKGLSRNRHQFCDIPRLIKHDTVLRECGVNSISRLEYSTHIVPVVKHRQPISLCTQLTPSTACLLTKMGALNKYKFMDYFRMKDSICEFARTHVEWQALNDAYISAFSTMPMYRSYCSSPKKLLNLIDSMLMTCPLSARRSSPKCDKLLNEISHSPALNPNATREQAEQTLNQFQHIFLSPSTQQNVVRTGKVPKKMYDFGIFDNGHAPPVRIIDVNPTAWPIKVLIPVYQQMHSHLGPISMHARYTDTALRSGVGLP